MPLLSYLSFIIPAINLIILVYIIFLVRTYSKVHKASIDELKSLYQITSNRVSLLENLSKPSSPSPNEATKEEEKNISLDEQTPWQIPQDVKIEIEGGDSIAPLGYEVTNANS